MLWIFEEKLLKSYVGLAATIMSIISDPKRKLRIIIGSRSLTFETLATDDDDDDDLIAVKRLQGFVDLYFER